jgi:hypothetical protein
MKFEAKKTSKEGRKNMCKKITIWLTAIAMAMAFPAFVLGAGTGNTSGGAISAPETPQLPSEEAPPAAASPSPALPISGMSETTYASEQLARTDIVDVSLPNEIPFDIVIFSSTGDGVVRSSDFLVTNNGAFAADVSVCAAHVTVANADAFSVRSDENLPEEGNNIYIRMLSDSAESSGIVLGARPSGENFGFSLESGASGAFRFEGVVNEHGDMKWEDTTVTITLRFEIATAAGREDAAPTPPSGEPAVPEPAPELLAPKPAVPEPAPETTAPDTPSEEESGSLPQNGEPAAPETAAPEPAAPNTQAEQAETPDKPSIEDAAALPDKPRVEDAAALPETPRIENATALPGAESGI